MTNDDRSSKTLFSSSSQLLSIESQEHFDLFIELTSTPKRIYHPPRSSTPRPMLPSIEINNQTRISRRSRRTLKRTYCKSAIFFRQLKRTFL